MAGVFKRASIRETTVLLAVAWLMPFAVHLVAWQGDRPLGAHLLPMFWAAFAAVYLFGFRTGLLVGLFAPALNLVLTGLPALSRLSWMSLEILAFVLCAWWIVRRQPAWWLVAPACFVCAKTAVTLLQIVIGVLPVEAWELIPVSILLALPGLVVLAGVNVAMIKVYPKAGGRRRDDAGGVGASG